ncbi:protein SRC2-like [Hordeum vulgare]|nr:protein SRC2-like [Hordeum vulgare]
MVDTSSELYAVVSFSGDPRSRQRVATDRSGGRNPTWNATVRFNVPANAAGSFHVLLRAERALDNRDVGEVHIPLSELLSGAPDGAVPVKFVAYQQIMLRYPTLFLLSESLPRHSEQQQWTHGYGYPPQQQLEVGQQQQQTHGYGYPPQQLEVGQLELEVGED